MSDAHKIEISEISVMMSTRGGRNFINRILERSGFFTDTFNIDPFEHAKCAGQRQIGLWLDEQLREAAPGEYITLMKERLNEQ